MFFDAQMLKHHTPTCNHKPIKPCGALDSSHTPVMMPIYKHKTGDDEEEEDEHTTTLTTGMGASSSATNMKLDATLLSDSTKVISSCLEPKLVLDDNGFNGGRNQHQANIIHDGERREEGIAETVAASGSPEENDVLGGGGGGGLKIKLPEVACTICGAHFSDQELFAKHIQMHEMELYTDNPLASMFDTGPADPNQFYMNCMNENGEYACDLCTKVFTQMTALKVHRKWHFRGDSKQVSLWTCAARQRVRVREPFFTAVDLPIDQKSSVRER